MQAIGRAADGTSTGGEIERNGASCTKDLTLIEFAPRRRCPYAILDPILYAPCGTDQPPLVEHGALPPYGCRNGFQV